MQTYFSRSLLPRVLRQSSRWIYSQSQAGGSSFFLQITSALTCTPSYQRSKRSQRKEGIMVAKKKIIIIIGGLRHDLIGIPHVLPYKVWSWAPEEVQRFPDHKRLLVGTVLTQDGARAEMQLILPRDLQSDFISGRHSLQRECRPDSRSTFAVQWPCQSLISDHQLNQSSKITTLWLTDVIK